MSASQRRISMTKWVGQAWKKISGMKESIIRSFEKRGLPVALVRLLDDDKDEDEDASGKEENDLTDQEIPLVAEQRL